MLQVITSNVPYELDYIEGKIDYINIKIPALSEKNLKYIESGIQDSNYNSSSNYECGKRYLDALRKGKSFSQKPLITNLFFINRTFFCLKSLS
jgi:hypothetical protein